MLQWYVSQERLISTDEIQLNHNPVKILLTKKEKVSQNGHTQKYNWDPLILCTRLASVLAKSNIAPPRADPIVFFPLLLMIPRHNKPHSPPTSP